MEVTDSDISWNTPSDPKEQLSTQLSQSSGYQTLEDGDVLMETDETTETSDSQMSTPEENLEEVVSISSENVVQKLKSLLNLKEEDRITHINGIAIENFTNIIELLRDDSGELIVKIRVDGDLDIEADNDKIEFLEVMLTYHKCDSLPSIILHKFTYKKPLVFDINFEETKNDSVCYIRSVEQTGKFLTCRNGKLTLSPIESLTDVSHQFKLYKFTAKQVVHGKDSRIQLRWFESLSEQKFITANYRHDVRLENFPTSSVQFNPNKPDRRFFKLLKSKKGYLFLESVVNPGAYLCCINGKIKLKIRQNIDTMEDADCSALSHENESFYLGN